jgi:hypothetical protein
MLMERFENLGSEQATRFSHEDSRIGWDSLTRSEVD